MNMMIATNLARQTGARFSLARVLVLVSALVMLASSGVATSAQAQEDPSTTLQSPGALGQDSDKGASKGLNKSFKGGLDLSELGLPEVPAVPRSPAAVSNGFASDEIAYSAQYTYDESTRRGQLRVTATLTAPWHTYSVTQAAGGPKPTKISVRGELAKLSGSIESEPAPEVSKNDLYPGVAIEEHADRVTWTAPLEFQASFQPGETKLDVVVDSLVCTPLSDGKCLPIKANLSAKYSASLKSATATAFRFPNTHADITAYLEPAEVKAGSTATLVLNANVDAGFHIYQYEQGNDDENYHTLIVPTQKSELLFGAPYTDAKVKSGTLGDQTYSQHEGTVQWRIPIRVPSNVSDGKLPIEVSANYFTCSDKACDPPGSITAKGFLTVATAPSGEKLSPFVVESTKRNEILALPNLGTWVDFQIEQDTRTTATASKIAAAPLNYEKLSMSAIFYALLGGFILNFMPCVLPVIGLKVMGFVDQAGSDRSEVIKLNLAYVLGILVVMWILAGITIATKNAFGWGQQFTLIEFKLAMAGLVFAMALSFLGVWEIPIPGFASSYKSNELMQREGLFGAFSKGLLTTILATPCSGPFLGFVFAITLTLAPLGVIVIYTMVGLGMGLPFLVLCLRPSMIKRLPKPGPWMETLKEGLAFPLLLTVIYFVASIGQDYRIATLSTLIAVWFGCWMIGKVPAYADRFAKIRVWTAALASIALWGMLSFSYLGPSKSELPWQPYSPERLATLRASGKTVMVDFTANWCLNCQWNTKNAIERPLVAALVEKNDIVPLLADWTEPSDAISAQIQALGSKTIPLLAIYPPEPDTEPIILKDVIMEKTLLDALKQAGPSRQPAILTSFVED